LGCAGESGLRRVQQAQDGWLAAQVPGEVHLDLIRAGQMPEPSVGANMPECRWPETKSWWYRTSFALDADFLQLERQELVFEGLDLYAQVFVNDQLVGESANAFVPAYFSVGRFLHAGQNELVVRLTAGNELALQAKWSAAIGGEIRGNLEWPRQWMLFGPVGPDDPEPVLEQLANVPAKLTVGDKRLTGCPVQLTENRLDLGALLSGVAAGKTAYLLSELTLDQETEATFGAGLDWWMKWWVNGQIVCDTTGTGNASSEIRLDDHCFNVRLRQGRNVLAVKAISGSGGFIWVAGGPRDLRQRYGLDQIPNPMRAGTIYRHRMWDGRRWLRKPQFSYGWDWVEALPNIGVWRGVHLEGRTHAVLRDLRLDTVQTGVVTNLELEAVVENLHPWSERACILDLEIQPPAGGLVIRRQYRLDVPPGCVPVRDMIAIPEARLWWPNGMGDQPLYRITARVSDTGGAVCDARQLMIGLRTVELDRSRLAEGSRFCFRVNGQEVFCRGGNVGPHDAILARVTDAKCEALVEEARNANLNMLRINGCSIFESPAFYAACDRAGIMVWQDFMFTCATYPDDDAAFCATVRAETESAIRLLRHHPSLVLWCGNNECAEGLYIRNRGKTGPQDVGGVKFYNQMLPDCCRQLDPRRPYWPGSPCGGDTPVSELQGDCHWWKPFFMNPDVNRRVRHEVFDECRSRFVSEYGVIGPCHLDSIKEYLAPADLHPASLAWRMHTNTFERNTVSAAIRHHYTDPEGLSVADYVRYGQMFQAIIQGYAMEALRFRKQDPRDDCQGALIWSYSDCWGETGWSILDYYLRRKASYYWVRRACRPLKVIVRRRGGKLVTRLVNDTLQRVSTTVEFGWWRLDGERRDVESRSVAVIANSMQEVASAMIPPSENRDPCQWLYAAVLRDEDDLVVDQSICLLLPYRELQVPKPVIKVMPLSPDVLEVVSPVFCHAVHVEDHGREALSDNWFDLLPGVPIRIRPAKGHLLDEIYLDADGNQLTNTTLEIL